MNLSERMQKLLDDRGFTVSEAAKLAGMSRQQLHLIVTGGNKNPGILTVARVVEAIGGTLGELLSDPPD